MKKLYSFVVTAERTVPLDAQIGAFYAVLPSKFSYRAEPSTLVAENKDEALGIALSYGKRAYPSEDGWTSHNAAVSEIKPEWLRRNGIELREIKED